MIREGRPEDLPRLRAIQAATLSDPWPELLETALEGPPLALVLEEGRPVAYALVVPEAGVAYLAEFAVAPDRQGEGLGTRLMEGLVERLREQGIGELRLTARADDERARGFYGACGFECRRRVPDHYDGADGVLYRRLL